MRADVKTAFCVICAALTLLALPGCGRRGGDGNSFTAAPEASGAAPTGYLTAEPTEQQAVSPSIAPFDPKTDMDNRFASLTAGIAETDEVIYWIPENCGYIMYYDKLTGECAPLCGKPECMHFNDGNVYDYISSCDAYICAEPGSLRMYEGKLYFIKYYQTSGSADPYWLFRMDADGTNKEPLLHIDPPERCAIQNYQLHRGRLYSYCYVNRVSDAEISCTLRVYSTPIDKGECEYTLMYERATITLSWCRMRFIGQYCYMFVCYQDDESKESCCEICRWNADTFELESLYDGHALGFGDAFWVTESGEIYSELYDAESGLAKLVRVTDGSIEILFDLDDGDFSFYLSRIADGVAVAYRDNNGNEWPPSCDWDVWIFTFGGETLYKGALPMHWTEDIQGNFAFQGFKALCCSRDLLIAEFEVRWTNATHQNEPKGYYLVLYELTEDGLVEIDAGSVYEKITVPLG